MNARRKPRTFSDHKPPLLAFVLVAVVSLMLLVHGARSDAAPSWLRQGVSSVVAGGAPLAQRVVSGTLLERAPAVPATTSPAEPPPVAVEPPAVVQPPAPASSAPPTSPGPTSRRPARTTRSQPRPRAPRSPRRRRRPNPSRARRPRRHRTGTARAATG